jgi:hypothetical protein
MRSLLVAIFSMLCFVGAPEAVRAQTTTKSQAKLSEVIPTLYLDAFEVDRAAFDLAGIALGQPGISGDAIFGGDRLDRFFAPADALTRSLGAQLTSFPVGSSAGGFSWMYDPTLGTFARVSGSFGSSFVERSLTIGRHKLNAGVTFQRATFDKIEGRKLRNGDIRVRAGATFPELGIPIDDAIFIEHALDLKLSMDTVGIFGTYGVTDRLDLGFAIPIVSVKMRASLSSQVLTSSGDFVGDLMVGTPVSDDASGIGDIVIRGKYNFLKRTAGGLAAAVDLRLPTGDEEDLLGVAGPQAKIFLGASAEHGRLSPHLNVGVTLSGESDAARDPNTFVLAPPNEFDLSGGMDLAATPRLTIVADLVGRTLRDIGRLNEVRSEFRSDATEFSPRPGNLGTVLGAVAVKYNAFGKVLLTANLLTPVYSWGLSDKLTWAVGLEYSF